jgi:hypothetical protein
VTFKIKILMKDLPTIIAISIFVRYTTWYNTKHSSTQTNASLKIISNKISNKIISNKISNVIISNKISVSFLVSYILPNEFFFLAKFCFFVEIIEKNLEKQFFSSKISTYVYKKNK